MVHPSDDNLDRLLRDYLSAQLDPQVGRASAHFRQHLGRAQAARTDSPRRRRRTAFGWAVGIVGGALAASVAVMAAAPAFWRHGGLSPDGEGGTTKPVPEPVMYTQVVGETIDEGTFLVDGKLPVRKLRRELVEQATWYDAEAGARVQVTVPRQDVTFVEMAIY